MIENWILLILVLSIAFEAITDGIQTLNKRRDEYMNHHPTKLLQTVALLFLLLIPELTIEGFIRTVTGYTLLRFALFDFMHNIAAGLHPLYIGSTSVYDKVLKKIFKGKEIWLMLIKGISMIVGMFLIQYYDKYF